jgi:hypothetical protein
VGYFFNSASGGMMMATAPIDFSVNLTTTVVNLFVAHPPLAMDLEFQQIKINDVDLPFWGSQQLPSHQGIYLTLGSWKPATALKIFWKFKTGKVNNTEALTGAFPNSSLIRKVDFQRYNCESYTVYEGAADYVVPDR